MSKKTPIITRGLCERCLSVTQLNPESIHFTDPPESHRGIHALGVCNQCLLETTRAVSVSEIALILIFFSLLVGSPVLVILIVAGYITV